MKKSKLLVISFIILLLLLACAPQSMPTPTPPKPASTQPSTAPTSSVSPLTSQDAAWAKVIEAAKKEGTLTIYSFNLVGDVGVSVARAFKERYGINVDIITGRGAEFVERMKTERRMKNMVADVNDGSVVFAIAMKDEGLTVSVADQLPTFKDQSVWLTNVFGNDPKDKHLVGLSISYFAPWVNTKMLATPADMPQVWRDLLKPQWKGKMILTDPTTSAGPQQFFVPLIREKAIDEDFLKALYKQDLIFSASLPDEGRMLSRGERSMSIRGSSNTLAKFAAEGAPIKAIDMKEGIVQLINPLAVVLADSPHPNAARLFMDWFLSKEGHTTFTKSSGAPPIRKDVPDTSPEAARLTPQKPIIQTVEDINLANQYYKDKWLDKMWGR